MEFDVGDADGHPGKEDGDCGQGLEPLKDFLGADGAGHVCQEGHGRGDGDAVVWDSPVL